MDLHVVWGWLDSVLNGCKRCFCYIIVHLTVQLCCIVKLFCMLFLQKMLKQIGGLVFLTFLGDRRNVSGWVQPNLFKKSDGKEGEPIALIVVPHLRNFGSVFYFIYTCDTRQKKKVWGSDFFFIIHLWNQVKNTEWHWVQIYRWNQCFFYFMSETDCLFFFPAWFHTWGKNPPVENDYMRKTLSWKKILYLPSGLLSIPVASISILINQLKSVKHQGLLAWVSFSSCWL